MRRRARRQVHPEEDVELDEGGEHEKYGVHAEAGAADLAVELEAIRGEGHVEEQEGREQGYRAVLEAARIDADVVLALERRGERGLDEPGQAQAEKDVERVGADRVADAHRAVTCDILIFERGSQ